MSPLDFKTISELKQHAKQILEEVQKTGDQVAITINGKPVAVIVPVPKGGFSMFPDIEKATARLEINSIQDGIPANREVKAKLIAEYEKKYGEKFKNK